MADDKSKRGARDRATVAANQKHEVDHLMEVGNISRDEALALIKKYDGNRAKIMADLAARSVR